MPSLEQLTAVFHTKTYKEKMSICMRIRDKRIMTKTNIIRKTTRVGASKTKKISNINLSALSQEELLEILSVVQGQLGEKE